MVLLRSSGACERVARSARGWRSRLSPRFFDRWYRSRRAVGSSAESGEGKVATLSRIVGTPRRTGGAQLWCPPPPRTPSRRRCGSRCWWPRRGVRWTPSTSPRPSSRCAGPASRRMRPTGGHGRTSRCWWATRGEARGRRARFPSAPPRGAPSSAARTTRTRNSPSAPAAGSGWTTPPGGSGAGASPAVEAIWGASRRACRRRCEP